MKSVSVYIDAACLPSNGKGGWAAVLLQPNGIFEIAGSEDRVTLDAMRIASVTHALNAIPAGSCVKIFSRYGNVGRAINLGWLTRWSENGWRRSNGAEITNVSYWESLIRAIARHENVRLAWNRHPNRTVYDDHAAALAGDAIACRETALRPCTLGELRRSGTTPFSSIAF